MRRFLIVDDHPLFREALESALQMTETGAEICEAASIEGAMEILAKRRDFDLALLDLSLPGTTGFSGLIRVRTAYPKLPVIVVSGHEEPAIVREALSLGVAGYVPKSTSRKQLAQAISEVLSGSIFVPAPFKSLSQPQPGEVSLQQILKRLKDLTPQQLLVLEMIRRGLQNKQIAFELKLAETTVKAHVSEILRKLEVYSRTKAVIEVARVDFASLRGAASSIHPPTAVHARR